MSTLQVGTIRNASGVEVYTAKAWVNFNGTGTVAIRASGNVSSITDNGTGEYTVNLTNAMPDVNFATTQTGRLTGSVVIAASKPATTSSATLSCFTAAGASIDATECCVAIFR